MTATFHEENAETVLAPAFPRLAKHLHEDGLRITEVAPVIAYLHAVLSSLDQGSDEDFYRRYAQRLEKEIREQDVSSSKSRADNQAPTRKVQDVVP